MRLIFVLAALGLAAVSSVASAAPRVITDPDWQTRPTGAELGSAYPAIAELLNLEGRAVVACGVNDLGVLVNCEIRSELPEGLGFGQAALALTERFRMKPKTIDGEPVEGGTVRVPLRFTLPSGEPKPPPAAPLVADPQRLAQARELWTRAGGPASLVRMVEARLATIEDDGRDPEAMATARRALIEAAEAAGRDLGDYNVAAFAAAYDERQLRALGDFAARPAGRVWLGLDVARPPPWLDVFRTWFDLVARDARGRFCATRICAVDLLALDPARQTAEIIDPQWLQEPGFEAVLQRLPTPLRLLRIGGAARLACRVGVYGVPEDCRVAGETPLNLGLGEAALALAPYFKLNGEMMGQGAAGETLTFVVGFPGENLPWSAPAPEFPPPGENHALALQVARLHLGERDTPPPKSGEPAPSAQRSLVDEAQAAFADATVAQQPALPDVLARAYAKTLTRAELEDLRDFLSSPHGRQFAHRETEAEQRIARARAYHIGRMSVAAGEAFCRQRACLTSEAPAAASVPDAVRP